MFVFCCGMLFWTICLGSVISSPGVDFSNVAFFLRNIAKVEDIDINMIGKFQQGLAKTVRNLLLFAPGIYLNIGCRFCKR